MINVSVNVKEKCVFLTHTCDLHKSCDFWQAFVFAFVCCCWLFATQSPTKKFKLPCSTCLFANLCIQTCYSFNFPFLANVELTILRSGCDGRYKTHAGSTHLHTREFHKIILDTGIVWSEFQRSALMGSRWRERIVSLAFSIIFDRCSHIKSTTFIRESRRKTPVAVSMKNNERLFSDGAMTVVCIK